ncbi:MAG: ABC transporter ATP-binding protein [Anaerolineales bacterium]|nr:ABC transporter ATP-binding protein [Chloroflexota bacterium]MBL7161510.1 ABC transporter ATP-binding protein [Anaerolineales bacterium]
MNSSKTEPILNIQNLSAVFTDGNGELRALDELSFSVQRQEFLCVIGPSGCGKSTLLRILGGLLRPTQGSVTFSGEPLVGPRRGVGFVFQNSNLMPWRSVFENIALPLEVQNTVMSQVRPQVQELVELVGLQGFENWLPRDLSGGMAQRVAIARALVHDPDVLLLDEPFGALDALTREKMGDELLRIAVHASGGRTRRKTIIMVTHAIAEAIFLADRVIVLSPRPGKIRMDVPIELPRPREERLRYTPEFGKLAQRLREAIG